MKNIVYLMTFICFITQPIMAADVFVSINSNAKCTSIVSVNGVEWVTKCPQYDSSKSTTIKGIAIAAASYESASDKEPSTLYYDSESKSCWCRMIEPYYGKFWISPERNNIKRNTSKSCTTQCTEMVMQYAPNTLLTPQR